jgi:PAS domain S-box-containing protein
VEVVNPKMPKAIPNRPEINIASRTSDHLNRALATLTERYRLAAKATRDLVWDWDLVTDGIEWNEAFENRLGFTRDDLGSSGAWWFSRVHPDDAKRVRLELDHCLIERSGRFESESRFMSADGNYAPIYDRGFVIRDAEDVPIRMVGAMQDRMILSSRPPRSRGMVRRSIANAKPLRIRSTTNESSRRLPAGRWSTPVSSAQ